MDNTIKRIKANLMSAVLLDWSSVCVIMTDPSAVAFLPAAITVQASEGVGTTMTNANAKTNSGIKRPILRMASTAAARFALQIQEMI